MKYRAMGAMQMVKDHAKILLYADRDVFELSLFILVTVK